MTSTEKGRVLLITGASRGLGSALARSALGAGFRLALIARSSANLEKVVRDLGDGDILPLTADVSNWSEIADATAAVEQHFGRIDGTIANAGIALPVSFFGDGGSDPEDWSQMVSTNVLGTALTARAALPGLARTQGHLVLLGSVAGRIMRPGLYSATKWAVSAMAASIRAEAVGTGVRVTVIHPGVIDSGDLRDDLRARPKLEPDSVAGAVLFALDQPASVDVNEIVLRPAGQPADC
ncbi:MULTISPECIES: SDR family oxidoreductase [Rhodococcus]|uniref:SDR family oxidoreductase n=1 Tax=Rhodococcus TaxID=1827 RepID=UPI0023E14293|nr:SDR family oxidoreductase [Rhodococcus sp. T2V]MDF3311010.1 SDR family oxidoreductase [Rhodococcus sp. T2V]